MNRLHEKGSAQLKYSLISNALCPVLDIDDATALKAVFRQNMLHNFVIPMCIHTDILKMFKAPVQTGFRYAFPLTAGSHPVDDTVRFVIKPCTFINIQISRIFA